MAYKFQVGPAQLSGALTQEGTIEVRDPNTGALVAHATDAGEISASADLKAGGGLDVEGNADIEGTLDAAGAVSLAASSVLTDIRGTLSVDEAATFDANVTILGDTQVGNNNADRITFNAQVESNFVSDGSGRTLGAPAIPWERLFVTDISASLLSGALVNSLNDAGAGAGIEPFSYDNSAAGVTVAISGAADLDPYRITMWSAGDDKFVNSKFIENAGNIELDTGADLRALQGDIKAVDGNLSASANIDAGGALDVEGTADIKGAVSLADAGVATSVRGTLSVTEAATFDADVTLGNAPSDTVKFIADVSSSLLPSDDSAFDIGADLERWANIYGDTIVASQLSGALKFNIQDGAGISDFTFDNTANVTVEVSGASDLDALRITMWSAGDDKFVNSKFIENAGHIELDTGADLRALQGDIKAVDGNLSASAGLDVGGAADIGGTLDVDGAATLASTLAVTGDFTADGNLTFGSSAAQDVVVYQAAVSSSVFPSHTDSWDLGSSTYRWDQIYAREVRADSFVGNIAFDIQRDNGTFAAETDLYIVTGSATAVILPSGEQGKVIRIKRDSTSSANVTLTPAGGESFDDGSPIILETAGAAITCVFNGAAGSGIWYII
jgi:hypothetical protein